MRSRADYYSFNSTQPKTRIFSSKKYVCSAKKLHLFSFVVHLPHVSSWVYPACLFHEQMQGRCFSPSSLSSCSGGGTQTLAADFQGHRGLRKGNSVKIFLKPTEVSSIHRMDSVTTLGRSFSLVCGLPEVNVRPLCGKKKAVLDRPLDWFSSSFLMFVNF